MSMAKRTRKRRFPKPPSKWVRGMDYGMLPTRFYAEVGECFEVRYSSATKCEPEVWVVVEADAMWVTLNQVIQVGGRIVPRHKYLGGEEDNVTAARIVSHRWLRENAMRVTPPRTERETKPKPPVTLRHSRKCECIACDTKRKRDVIRDTVDREGNLDPCDACVRRMSRADGSIFCVCFETHAGEQIQPHSMTLNSGRTTTVQPKCVPEYARV